MEKINENQSKKDNLYLLERQKQTLKILLEKGAITKEQHDYSLSCLLKRMKI